MMDRARCFRPAPRIASQPDGRAANLAAVTHLRPVPDPKPPPRAGASAASARAVDRRARALGDRAADRLRADARGREVGPPRLLALGRRHRRRALLPRPAPRPRATPTGRSATASSSARATPRRSSTRRSPQHGYFPLEDLMGLRQIGVAAPGPPRHDTAPRASRSRPARSARGSRCASGICLALRLDGLDETAQVFGVLSDGDCQEGQTWEAATAAAHFGVPNLTAIVDYNHLQTDGTTEEVMDIGDVRAKFEAFGWDAVEIDGHDMGAGRRGARAQPHPRPPGGDRLPDQEGPRRLVHGGPLRLPRQAADARSRPTEALEELEATLEEQTKALQARAIGERADRCRRGQDRADRHPARLRRRAGRARRAPRGGRRARRRPRRLDPVDEVRQAVPRALLQRRRGRGEHDVDGLRPRRHRQGALLLDLRDLRHRPRLRPGPARHRPQRAQGRGSAPRTAASRSARTAPRTR